MKQRGEVSHALRPGARADTTYVPGRTAGVEDTVSRAGCPAVTVELEKEYERPGTGGEAESESKP